ncbi:hypothetical protein SAMN03080615_01662 [Amphritea atlantica]|uniref:Uncharacterized protein n=1 Tax=Amphritea atlantica TaxID=355243 RepID=A0A1H9GG12_9GAMM|nr:hypothetical protein [Amphritea atlantica]SEQ49044.1 hypothetical protein SAMN03080615_01662 [Amphritea atlantica]
MSMTVEEFKALDAEAQLAAIEALAEELGIGVGDIPINKDSDLVLLYTDGLESLEAKQAADADAKTKAPAEKLMTFTKTVRFADGKDGKKKFFMKKGETLPESEVTAATRKALKADGHIE